MSKQIKDSLRQAVEQLPHPDVKALWEQPVTPMREHDYITKQETFGKLSKHRGSIGRAAIGFACMCLVFLGSFGWYGENMAVTTIVGLDVNPSIEITTNKKHKVLSVDSYNEAGRDMLDGKNYKGWDVADTVETLALFMEKEGYFSDGKNAVLLTVNSKQESDAIALTRELSGKIILAVDTEETPTTVVSQTLPMNRQFEKMAKEHHVSSGKARLAAELSAIFPQYTPEQLMTLPVETLLEAIEGLGEDKPEDIVIESSRHMPVSAEAEQVPEETTVSVLETMPPPETEAPAPETEALPDAPRPTNPPKKEQTASPPTTVTPPPEAPAPPPLVTVPIVSPSHDNDDQDDDIGDNDDDSGNDDDSDDDDDSGDDGDDSDDD